MISALNKTNELSCKSELGKIKNDKVYSTILEGSETMEDVNKSSRTELDSHANMPVIGRNADILSKIGETVDVAPFTPDYKPISVELVDAALKYECPYSGEVKILIIRRGLHVPSMTHNLLPPFMLREAGIQINDVPKIHVTSPSEEHHAIIFQETNFRIPLTLHGTFSYFPTSKPTTQELEEPEDVYVLTPTTWNPHSDAYVINEESMLDWEGNMKHERDHEKRVLLEDIPSDDTMISSLALCEKEQMAVSSYFVDQDEDINATYGFEDEHQLYHAMNMRNEHGQFAMSIGATSILDQPYLDDDDDSQSSEEDDISHDDPDDEFDLKELDDDTNEILLDNFMASTAQAGKTRGVDPKHLAKIWRISHEDAQRTIDVTTQTSTRTDDPTLSRNYSTNDRMLRYKRIKDYFFMDTFFATKKGGQSSRGHTCCQLFVTDKEFIYVVPMKKKSEVLLAIKQFAKEIGAPDSFVADMSGEQMSSEVKKFCNDIGTTLKALEEGTPWSNKAELYIGLIKEAVRKDMRESNSPLCLWDYCVERRARINNLTAKNVFKLHGSTPHTVTTGDEGNISNLCRYGWYEWCYFRDHTAAFPNNKEVLGRVLGPARGAGNEMAQWILKANGRVVPRRSLRPLKVDEIHSPVEIKKREVFDELIKRRWGTPMTPPNTQQPKAFEKYEDHPDVPTITKALPIIKWTEAFQDFLHRVIGARMIPLAYVIRTNPQVPGIAPTLAPNQPHSTEHGSVEEELIARASHTHALFRDDNSVVYYHLEKATRGTSYAASIKPFTRATDGRGAWKTGVHLRYYKTGEYRNLTNEQKEELKEWRANNPNTFKAGSKKAKKENPKKSKQSMKKQVASLVEAALNKSVKFDDQVNDEEKYIMSMVQAAVTKDVTCFFMDCFDFLGFFFLGFLGSCLESVWVISPPFLEFLLLLICEVPIFTSLVVMKVNPSFSNDWLLSGVRGRIHD